MNQIFQVGFKPAPENYKMILDAIVDAIKQYKPKRIEMTDDLHDYLWENDPVYSCHRPYYSYIWGIPIDEYPDADGPYSYRFIDIENEPKLFEGCFAKLDSDSTYVVEFNDYWTPKQMKEYIEWLKELAGNEIKFIPSSKKARIARGN